jgi:DNA invertase Pin-like site-specific DNA recombinase
MGEKKAAIWARVSTDHQVEANQVPDLERFCAHHGYEITRRYLLSDVSAYNGAHRETLKRALDDAWRG